MKNKYLKKKDLNTFAKIYLKFILVDTICSRIIVGILWEINLISYSLDLQSSEIIWIIIINFNNDIIILI